MGQPERVDTPEPEAKTEIEKIWDKFEAQITSDGRMTSEALDEAKKHVHEQDALTLTCFMAYVDGYMDAKDAD